MSVAAPLLALSPALLHAQSADQAGSGENWATGCTTSGRGEPLDCSIVQRAIDSRTNRLLAMVRLRLQGANAPVMLVQMPLGIYLPAKLTLTIDGATVATLEFQTCDQNGCYAGTPVSDGLLDGMLKGEKLDLTIQSQARQPASVPISLIGFAKAYGRIR